MTDSSSTRLNKYLALHLGVSRREADLLIEKGKVLVNDSIATLGSQVTPTDTVTVAGKTLTEKAQYQYIAFNKPRGYVCSRKRQGDNETIYALLPTDLHVLKPVGRLDKDSSGLLMLTNDGDFAHRMTHPKFHKIKVYTVRLDRDLEPLHQQMISDYGVRLEDGISKFALARLSEEDRKEWQITMSEGRNRQIRRTFAALGYATTQLHRTTFGAYSIGDIKPGKYSFVDMH